MPDVDAFIDSQKCVKICAYLCNATKPCTLTRKLRTLNQPHLAVRQNEGASEGRDAANAMLKSSFTVLASGQLIDALQLAENCIHSWDKYIALLQAQYAERADSSK